MHVYIYLGSWLFSSFIIFDMDIRFILAIDTGSRWLFKNYTNKQRYNIKISVRVSGVCISSIYIYIFIYIIIECLSVEGWSLIIVMNRARVGMFVSSCTTQLQMSKYCRYTNCFSWVHRGLRIVLRDLSYITHHRCAFINVYARV